MFWSQADNWIKMYGMPIARPVLAALWLVALYAFPTALGMVGVWIWLVPTVVVSWALLVSQRAHQSGHG